MSNILKSLEKRRTMYALSNKSNVSDERIKSLVEEAISLTPSAFNSQSSRLVLLFGNDHNKLWDTLTAKLKAIVPPESFPQTEEKINSFKAGHGTILYFEDQSVVKGLQEQFPLYAANFPIWSEQSSGMLQLVIWSALSEEGLGASLQHYGEVFDNEVKKAWNLPETWKFIAQMPFGTPTAGADPKPPADLSARLKIFGM